MSEPQYNGRKAMAIQSHCINVIPQRDDCRSSVILPTMMHAIIAAKNSTVSIWNVRIQNNLLSTETSGIWQLQTSLKHFA